MVRFILKRLGLALITLWILSVIVFVLGQVLPSDPGRSILGPLAAPSAVTAQPPRNVRRPTSPAIAYRRFQVTVIFAPACVNVFPIG